MERLSTSNNNCNTWDLFLQLLKEKKKQLEVQMH